MKVLGFFKFLTHAEVSSVAIILGAGLVVKLVLLLLLSFSVISWSIILFKFFQVQRANSESERFMDFFWKSKRLGH